MRGFFIGCDMATTINEFLPFADQSNANLIPYAEWVDAAKRLTGFVSGIAKSSEMNRVFAQGAQAGYAIAKFIERTLSEDVYVSDGERLADQFYRAIVQMSYRATPIGCILTFPVHVEIDGYVATNNGGNLSQTTYDQLYAVYGTKFNTSSTLANQFGIPDMAHRVFEAAATLEEIGCYVELGYRIAQVERRMSTQLTPRPVRDALDGNLSEIRIKCSLLQTTRLVTLI